MQSVKITHITVFFEVPSKWIPYSFTSDQFMSQTNPDDIGKTGMSNDPTIGYISHKPRVGINNVENWLQHRNDEEWDVRNLQKTWDERESYNIR